MLKRNKAPEHLRDDGAAFWRAVLDDFDIGDAAGLRLLLVAAECVDRMAAARAEIAERGEVILDRYGCPKVHPACQLERDARNGFLAAMRSLQLEIAPPTPIGRPPRDFGWKGG